jgi:hypothetical protein
MASRVETDMSAFEAALDAPTFHCWPKGLPYRRSGAGRPQAGDLALCGAVKLRATDPASGRFGPVNCDHCLALLEAGL